MNFGGDPPGPTVQKVRSVIGPTYRTDNKDIQRDHITSETVRVFLLLRERARHLSPWLPCD